MNKRQCKKYIKNRYHFLYLCSEKETCGQECDGCTFRSAVVLRQMLRRKKISFCSWTLIDSPLPQADLFYCSKRGGNFILVNYNKKIDHWNFYKKEKKHINTAELLF